MVKFIAEICSNHNQNLDRALSLTETAAEIGCNAVKFQLFKIDQLFAPEILNHPDYQYLHERRAWELPLSWLSEIRAKCDDLGLEFGCTPFYLDAVEKLDPFVDFFKIASYELGWSDLVRAVAETDKPVLISCGLATVYEIRQTVGWYRETKRTPQGLTLLHCVSEYPAPLKKCNLLFINRLRQEFLGLDGIGYSDHSVNSGVIYRAIQRGAKAIEFHLDLEDGQGVEYDIGHCWKPSQIAPAIQAVKDGEQADGGTVIDVEQFSDRDFRRDPDELRPMKYKRENL